MDEGSSDLHHPKIAHSNLTTSEKVVVKELQLTVGEETLEWSDWHLSEQIEVNPNSKVNSISEEDTV